MIAPVVCMFCNVIYAHKEGFATSDPTHGVCHDCNVWWREDMDRQYGIKTDYVDLYRR